MINIFGNKWFSTFHTVSSGRFPKVKFLIKGIKITLVSICFMVSVAYARHCSKCLCLCVCACTQLRPTLCDPMACSPPGSSVCGILQGRILSGWPFPSSGDLPHPGIEPKSLASLAWAGRFFTTVPPGKPQKPPINFMLQGHLNFVRCLKHP